ncbi:C45 family autoproteolytic acyltransferase/hydolase [Bradyrhizobium sp. BR13661]|jgi:predicted choloylglycine hydrolase|uniref:C45 family autoproteolytic acyltransferase/hydolase n=1 Tax=Bradyrhizobium sp. BR13661 TaxID=2940622 RepID=UPI002473B2A5|nr:C45 family autoproteolytic acyltransferase/hydolase [Bradyrhizobium sp. BR13661]MDH6260749.1 putative choloylglycine hydrolase [Bradyrhizobium sp. BR13661]
MASAPKMLRVVFVQCRGTPYEVGRAQADAFAATLKGKAFLRRKNVRLPWWFDIRTEERAFRTYAPDLWEEIGGIAEGLNIPMERAVAHFGNDGLRMPTGGCSAVMSGGVYGRNYDFWPRGYEARFALIQVQGSYASIGGSHQMTGRLDGMNEHGLSIGLHLVRARPRSPGLTSTLLIRRVLDSCATTAEAIAFLRRTPHAMSYNYSLLDAGGVAAVVEAGAGAVAVRLGDWLACTNHFQSTQLRALNRRVAHSIDRLPPLEGWAARALSAEQTFSALNLSASPAFHNYGNCQTLHTIVAEPVKRRLLIGIGGDAAALEEDMLDVDFGRWVSGEDLAIGQLRGQLGLGRRMARRTRRRVS